jgi:hypothetical protein
MKPRWKPIVPQRAPAPSPVHVYTEHVKATDPGHGGQHMVDPHTSEMTPAARVVQRMSVSQALTLKNAGQAVLVDTRDARLYENLHAAGALSVPAASLEGSDAGRVIASLPRDQILILYCA